MKTSMVEQTSKAIGPDDVREALDRILQSRHFINAHKKKKFLRLICDYYIEGRAQELNEHTLGYDVFGRDKSYNPSDDPIVRVFAHEIRKKLEAYYSAEGASDPVRLEIPAGSYQPVFTRREVKADCSASEASFPPQPAAQDDSSGRRVSLAAVAAGIIFLCLAVAVLLLAVSNLELRQKVAETNAAIDPARYGEMWTPFLEDNNPPLVILSNPHIFRFTNPSDPEEMVKDSIPLTPETVEALKDKFVTNPEVSIKESDGPSGDRVVIERNRTPRLTLSRNIYTGVGEAIGLHYLTDFFRRSNRSIGLKQSRTLTAEDLKKHNVILLGGVWVNEWSGKLTKSEDFVFTNKATIENRNPQPGEEREYIPQFDRRTGNLIVDYALITVKPNISDANEVMLLAGVYNQGTEAAAEYVTNESYLDQLNHRLRQIRGAGGSTRYFQALLKVGVENGIPTTISILAIHELRIPES